MSDNQVIFNALVEQGRRARGASDEARWLLGDLAVEFCAAFGIDPKAGRPSAGREGMTLAFYAQQIDVGYKSLSEYRLTSGFYAKNIRDARDLSWAHYNTARRQAAGKLDNALELLDRADAGHMTADQFRQWCAGEYWQGDVAFAELPARIQGFVPAGETVYVVIRRRAED